MNHKKTIVSAFTIVLILLMTTSVLSAVHNSGMPKTDDIYYKAYPAAPPEVLVDEFIEGTTDWLEGPSRLDLYNKVLGNNTYNAVHDVSPMDPMAEFTFAPINCRDYKLTLGDPNAPLNDSSFRLAMSYVYGQDDKAVDVSNYYGVAWVYALDDPVPDAQEPWHDASVIMPNTSNATAWTILSGAGYSIADYGGQQWLHRNGVPVRPDDGPNGGYITFLYSTGSMVYPNGPGGGMVRNWNGFITDYMGAEGPLMQILPRDFGALVTDLLLYRDYDIIGIGLTNLGRYVDWIYDCFHSDNDVPWGWNFCGIHDAELDAWGFTVLTSMSPAQVQAATENFTAKFVYELMPWFPLIAGLEFCTTANDTGTHGGHLTNVVNMDNFGPGNDWSWMSLHWEGAPGVVWPGGSYARCMGDIPDTLNPWTDDTAYGRRFLDRAIFGLNAPAPDTLNDMPLIATNWTVDHWTSIPELGIAAGSTAQFYLRQDVPWQDYNVTGEWVDAYDCVANMRFLREYHPGRYSGTWANLVYEEADGPYKFNVYFDQTSLYYAGYVAGTSLLVPEHIIDDVEAAFVDYQDWRPCDGVYFDLTGVSPPADYPWMTQLVGCGPYVFRNYDRGLATGRVTKFDDFFINAPVIGSVVGEWRVNPLEGYEYRPMIQNLNAKEADNMGTPTAVTVDVGIYEDGVIAHVVNDTVLGLWDYLYLGPYTFPGVDTTIGVHTVTVKIHGSGLLHTYDHTFVATIREDLNTYANVLLDFKVDMRDIGVAARAFGSYPGHLRWEPVADVNDDFKVDMRDIGACARQFGWP